MSLKFETRKNISTLDILNKNIIKQNEYNNTDPRIEPNIFVGYTGTAEFQTPKLPNERTSDLYISDVNNDSEKEEYINFIFTEMVKTNPVVKIDMNNIDFSQHKDYFKYEKFKKLIKDHKVFIDAGSYMLGRSDEDVAKNILLTVNEHLGEEKKKGGEPEFIEAVI